MRSKCIELTVVTAFEGYSIRLFHDTRHTFASRAIEKNTPVPVLQSILNHRNIKTTMRYVHNTFEQKLNAVNNLDNY